MKNVITGLKDNDSQFCICIFIFILHVAFQCDGILLSFVSNLLQDSKLELSKNIIGKKSICKKTHPIQ